MLLAELSEAVGELCPFGRILERVEPLGHQVRQLPVALPFSVSSLPSASKVGR